MTATAELPVITTAVGPVATFTGPDWNPRCDPAFREVWLNHLIRHVGEWVHATDLWATDDEWQRSLVRQVAWETVVAARRLGYVIDGDREAGYCYRWSTLPRYLHLHERAEDHVEGPLPGQLSLSEGVYSEHHE